MISFILSKRFSTKFTIISAIPSYDLTGSKIISALSKHLPDSQFKGIGGKFMQKAGLKQFSGMKDTDFIKNPWINYQRYFEVTTESILSPISTPIHYCNNKVLKKWQNSKQVKDYYQNNLTNYAFIILGNQIFVKKFYASLKKQCIQQKRIRPPTFFVNMRYNNFKLQHQEYIDHIFSYIPKRPNNYQYYGFPSTTIGYPGVYQALTRFTGQAVLPFQQFKDRLQQSISRLRSQYRNELGLAEKFVILFSPGSNMPEAEFSVKQLKKMFNQYFKGVNKLTKQSFTVLITLPNITDKQQSSKIQMVCEKLNSIVQIKYINQDKRHDAMAAADFGLVFNGQMAAEAAACHLSTLVIDNMSFSKAYFQNLFNMRVTALNLVTNRLGFQQLKCQNQCTSYRLNQILEYHIKSPKIYDKPLYEMRPRINHKHVDGISLAASKIIESIKAVQGKSYIQKEDVDSRRLLLPHLKDTRGMYYQA